jgi:hypothetical protein
MKGMHNDEILNPPTFTKISLGVLGGGVKGGKGDSGKTKLFLQVQ